MSDYGAQLVTDAWHLVGGSPTLFNMQPIGLRQMNEQQKTRRLIELDVLRGLAAVAVVLCHYFTYCRDWGRTSFDFAAGAYGPHLFFMISGFVIFMSLQHLTAPQHSYLVASRVCTRCTGWPFCSPHPL